MICLYCCIQPLRLWTRKYISNFQSGSVTHGPEIHNTVRRCYNAVKFLLKSQKIHPTARPLGRDVGCYFWFETLIDILLQSTQCCMKYRVMLDRVITALDCTILKQAWNRIQRFAEIQLSSLYITLWITQANNAIEPRFRIFRIRCLTHVHSWTITMTSTEGYDVSDHRPLDSLFNGLIRLSTHEESKPHTYYWPVVGINMDCLETRGSFKCNQYIYIFL